MRRPEEGEIDRLVAAEYPRLVRTAQLITGDRRIAEEIAQEALARLVERWGRLRRYDDPGAWLRLVVVRLARRHRDRPAPAVLDAAGQSEAGGRRVDDGAAARVAVATAIAALPPAQREVVVLFYVYDLTAEAIAESLGRRPGTIRAQLHQARQKLAVTLAEEVTDVGR